MAYIGRDVTYGLFEVQYITANSSDTSFALDYAVGAASSILVVYGGVIQEPDSAYSITNGGANILFSEAPVTGTTTYIVYMAKQLTVATVADNSITTAKLANNSVTSAKIVDGTITRADLSFDPEDDATALAIALG